jgi:hypothetical protein
LGFLSTFVSQSQSEVQFAADAGTYSFVGGPRVEQRGYALLDLAIGAAIGLTVFAFLVSLLHTLVVAASSRHALMLARSQSEQLLERMHSEAASAWSITVPPSDIFGASNADGHEVDFTTEDSTHTLYHWAYLYESAAQSLTRYVVEPGSSARPEMHISGITAFAAHSYPAEAIGDPTSAIYDPLFTAIAVTPVSYVLADGSVAGNGFVQVALEAAGTSATDLLSTGVAPTQFTIVVQYTPTPQ